MFGKLLGQRLNRTTMLMYGCGGFLGGLALARKYPAAGLAIVAVTIAASLFALKKRKAMGLAVVVLAGLLLGLWRGQAYMQRLAPYHEFARQPVTFTATANIDAVYGKSSQLSFVGRDIAFIEPNVVKVPGTVKVSGFGETMVYRGDKLLITGKLYPTRGASQATVSFAKLEKVSSTSSPIDTMRRKFAAGLQSALPEPLASFGLGLLVGQRNTLPDTLTQALLMVGLTHIIAVSGYNLTILLEASRRALGNKSKALFLAAALGLIMGFLLIAGTSASIVRAAVISILGLSAWYYGRTIRPVLLILLAAAGTAYANPVYLWADIGWYLSFLAFFGILVLAPVLMRWLFHGKQPSLVQQILVESLCAEIMTIPLVLYIFGQMSLVSLLANMLVVALIPVAMLLTFIAGLAGMLAGSVAGWFAWPAQLLLTYMLDIVTMLSHIPHVFVSNHYLSLVDMVLCYGAIIGLLGMIYWSKKRRKQLWYNSVTRGGA